MFNQISSRPLVAMSVLSALEEMENDDDDTDDDGDSGDLVANLDRGDIARLDLIFREAGTEPTTAVISTK